MTIPLQSSTGGKIDDTFVYITRRIRIPRTAILSVKPSPDGEGATVVTERGAMRICEDYNDLIHHLYGADIPNRQGAGAHE